MKPMSLKHVVSSLLLPIMLLALVPGTVSAEHHGNPGIGSFLDCDPALVPPRCVSVGNDSIHRVYIDPSVPNGIAWAVRRSMSGDYGPTHLVMRVQSRITRMLQAKGKETPRQLHRRLGHILWDHVGMARNEQGLKRALTEIPRLRDEFWQNLSVPGDANNVNKNLEYAGRVADYLEFAETLALDALHRTESCGGHFREESQTPDGEALRDDEHFSYVAAWEFQGVDKQPTLHREPLEFEYVKPTQRSYK